MYADGYVACQACRHCETTSVDYSCSTYISQMDMYACITCHMLALSTNHWPVLFGKSNSAYVYIVNYSEFLLVNEYYILQIKS